MSRFIQNYPISATSHSTIYEFVLIIDCRVQNTVKFTQVKMYLRLKCNIFIALLFRRDKDE